MAGATGPAIRAVCNVLNQNSCGSGSICGITDQGKSLIMTNAHVAGSRIGRRVQVTVESTGDRLACTVVRAAYSSNVVADWALLETEEPYDKVAPVYLTKSPPTGSHYTKGFPRCRPHNGTDITTFRFLNNGVWLWTPDAIGGQSGSGVWSDDTNFQQGLLTWSYTISGRGYGGGQPTSMIYTQNRSHRILGYAKPPGLVELHDYDIPRDQLFDWVDDPEEPQEGFQSGPIKRAAGIQDYPIWAEDQAEPLPPPDDRPDAFTLSMMVNHARRMKEHWEDEQERFESKLPPLGTNGGANPDEPDDPYSGGLA